MTRRTLACLAGLLALLGTNAAGQLGPVLQQSFAGGLLALLTTTPAGAAPTGELALKATLAVRGDNVSCPPGAGATTTCHRTDSNGLAPGLGRVSYPTFVIAETNVADCPSNRTRVRGFETRLTVAGKGTIDVEIANSAACESSPGTYSRPFTVTGGTGAYAQVSGGGTFLRRALPPYQNDTWSGTLVVPGLEFDLGAPTFRGAAPKTVRAPEGATRARVRYSVTAQDAVDGRLPVSCTPKSGSRFRLGRTKVTCSAVDSSGNSQTATFFVRVVRAR